MMIVDRIEEGIAVVFSNGEKLELPLSDLPEGVREGSVLVPSGSGYVLDMETEQRRRMAIAEKMDRLFGGKK